MVLSDSEQEFSLWQTQPEIQQLAAIIAAVKGKGRKKEEAPTAVRGRRGITLALRFQ